MHAVTLLSDVFIVKYARSLLGAIPFFPLQDLGCITLLHRSSPGAQERSPGASSAGTAGRLNIRSGSGAQRRSVASFQASHPDTNWPAAVRNSALLAKRSGGDALPEKITHPPVTGTAPDGHIAAKHTSAHQPASKLICQVSPNNFCILKHVTIG